MLGGGDGSLRELAGLRETAVICLGIGLGREQHVFSSRFTRRPRDLLPHGASVTLEKSQTVPVKAQKCVIQLTSPRPLEGGSGVVQSVQLQVVAHEVDISWTGIRRESKCFS